LDAWLAAGNVSSYTIRYFLGWAHSRGLAGELVVPAVPRHDPKRILDDEKRWNLLRRSLTDELLPLDVRAAAALVLLFGLPVSRIRHLTADQLELGADRSVLRTGPHPLLLPPKLAVLLERLATAPHTRSRLAGGENSTRWLFPGLTPGRPASQSSFQVKLRRPSGPGTRRRSRAVADHRPTVGRTRPTRLGRLHRRTSHNHPTTGGQVLSVTRNNGHCRAIRHRG
jgi:hypothetical protein